jgi:hypothetical protein
MRNQNFSIQAGDDLDLVVTVRDSDDCDAVDLTSATAVWVLARNPGCTPLLTKTGSLSDAVNGEVTITLEPEDTADLCAGRYHHELQVRDALSKTSTVMTGVARIVGDSAP